MQRDSGDRATLPRSVADLADRLGAGHTGGRSVVSLTQVGGMRNEPAGREMKFGARQRIELHRPEFEWRARTGPVGCISVTDALRGDEPQLEVRAFGFIRIAVITGGAPATKGEIMRYLAELAWAPDAIVQNPHLTWSVVDDRTLEVGYGSGSARGEVALTLDRDGRIESVFAPDRPRKEGAGFTERPWRGRFFDYRSHAGRWLPFAAEVGWTIGGSDFVAWRGELTSWSLEFSES
jgi:hypothetical protein